MLIFNINGGLGNQMFQYAFALYLSEKYKRQICFDLENLNSNQLRTLGLHDFQIDIPLATATQLRRFKKSKYARVNYFLNKLFLNGSNYFYEPKLNNKLVTEGSSYYWGYWQKPQYIKEVDQRIRELFVLKNPLNLEAKFYENKIASLNGESVAIHIRKTDYLLHKNNYFSSCEAEYYYQAIDTVCKSRSNNLHFFVFSDDFKWVEDNLEFRNISYTFVNPKTPNRPSEDLYLMSICSHNIIANSTFSWWAAYLNSNKNKIVISPKFWFKDHTRKNINLKDWIEIENE